jgi:hypothetical protein
MDTTHLVLLFIAVGLIAFLYSSVGHAGASGYIATMTLFGLAPTVIRPTALVLNILVASIGTFQFWRAGHFSWKLFWPFALLSIPAAYVGGYLQPSASILRILIGVVLLFSAARLVFRRSDPPQAVPPSRPVAIGVGAGLGFLSGIVHLGKLDCRAGWLFYKSSFNSFARSHPGSGCDYRRCRGIPFGQQAFCCESDLAFSGDSPSYRRNEINFDEVKTAQRVVAAALWAPLSAVQS